MKRLPPIIEVLIGLGVLWTIWIGFSAFISYPKLRVHRTQIVSPRSGLKVVEEMESPTPHDGPLTYAHTLFDDIPQKIEPLDPPKRLLPHSTFFLSLVVHNSGLIYWSTKNPIHPLREGESRFEEYELQARNILIAHHWLDEKGRIVDSDRSLFPHDVPAGESLFLKYEVTTPKKPGHYRLIVGIIQNNGIGINENKDGLLKLPIQVG